MWSSQAAHAGSVGCVCGQGLGECGGRSTASRASATSCLCDAQLSRTRPAYALLLQDRVTAWSGIPITSAPAAPPPGGPQPMAAMAAAAAGRSDASMGGGGAYPAVMRDILGEVPSPMMGRGQVYPNIPPGGVASQFNAAAAAAAGDQVRSLACE
jgi:hypothetical protein